MKKKTTTSTSDKSNVRRSNYINQTQNKIIQLLANYHIVYKPEDFDVICLYLLETDKNLIDYLLVVNHIDLTKELKANRLINIIDNYNNEIDNLLKQISKIETKIRNIIKFISTNHSQEFHSQLDEMALNDLTKLFLKTAKTSGWEIKDEMKNELNKFVSYRNSIIHLRHNPNENLVIKNSVLKINKFFDNLIQLSFKTKLKNNILKNQIERNKKFLLEQNKLKSTMANQSKNKVKIVKGKDMILSKEIKTKINNEIQQINQFSLKYENIIKVFNLQFEKPLQIKAINQLTYDDLSKQITWDTNKNICLTTLRRIIGYSYNFIALIEYSIHHKTQSEINDILNANAKTWNEEIAKMKTLKFDNNNDYKTLMLVLNIYGKKLYAFYDKLKTYEASLSQEKQSQGRTK